MTDGIDPLPRTRFLSLFQPLMLRSRYAPTLLLLLAACGDVAGSQPAKPRTFQAVSADEQALPDVAECPRPFGDNSEAFVTFGSGTLTLFADGTFTWHFEVSRGYRIFRIQPNGQKFYDVQDVEGGPREIAGSWGPLATGGFGLTFEHAHTSGTPLTGSGQVLTDGTAVISDEMDCPHAPEGTPPHQFRIVLLQTR